MPALSINVPFPVFQDQDGQPLDNGYVYIGTPYLDPQTNPVQVYFDDALTIPAAQPLRTINGYVSNAGTPAQLYVNGVNFSIKVLDSKANLVYSFPDGSGISPNASGVQYDPAGTGAVATTVQEKLRESVSVKDFGAVGDNVTNDRAAFTAAFAASDWVRLTPGKTYFLGNVTSNDPIFQFSGANKGVDFNGAAVRVNTVGVFNAPLFQLDNIDGFTLLNPVISDAAFNPAAPNSNTGITGINFNPITGPVRNVHVTRAKFSGMLGPFGATSAAYDAENIWFDGDVYDCYYGLNLANNGHNVTADYRTYGVVRSYFCYGVRDHVINCVSTNHNAFGDADFKIVVREPARPTRCIKANFVSVNSQASTNPQLSFDSIPFSGGVETGLQIWDCDISYNDSQSPLVSQSISFRHYNNAGVLQLTDPNTKARIKVNGFARGTVTYFSEPTNAQLQNLDGCLGLLPSFCAYKSSISSNVTGDGTVVDVVFDTVLNDYTSSYVPASGLFVAPRDGVYTFSANVLILGRTVAETRVEIRLFTSVKRFYSTTTLSAGIPIPENNLSITVPRLFLKKGQTANVELMSSGGAKVIDIFGDSGIIATFFSGGLVEGSPKAP